MALQELCAEAQLARDLFSSEKTVTATPIESVEQLFGADNMKWLRRGQCVVLRLLPDNLEFSTKQTGNHKLDKEMCAQLAFEAIPSKRLIDMLGYHLLEQDLSLAASPFGGLRGEAIARRVPSRLRKRNRGQGLVQKTNEQLRDTLALLTGSDKVHVQFQQTEVSDCGLMWLCRVITDTVEVEPSIACETVQSCERIGLITALARVL